MILLAGVMLMNLAARGNRPAGLVVFVLDCNGYALERAGITRMVSRLRAFRGCHRLIEMTKGACVDDRLVLFDPPDLGFQNINRGQAFCFEEFELLMGRE